MNAAIPKLLGMRLAEFRASYMCEQKDLDRIAAMKPTERQGFFREVLGIGRIDDALGRVRARRNEIANQLEGLRAGLGERRPLEEQYDAAERDVERLATELERARDDVRLIAQAAADAMEALNASTLRQRRHQELEQRRGMARNDLDRAAAELDAIARQLDAAHAARARVSEAETRLQPLAAYRAEHADLRVAEARAGERRQIRERVRALHDRLGSLREIEAQAAGVIAQFDADELQRVATMFREAEARLKELREQRIGRVHDARARVRAAQAEAVALGERIDMLRAAGPDGACPTCARPLAEHLSLVLAELEQQLQRANSRISEAADAARRDEQPTDEELALEESLNALRTQGERLKELRAAANQARQQLAAVTRERAECEHQLELLAASLAALPDTTPDPERLAWLAREIAALETLDRSLAKDREIVGRSELLHQQRETWLARQDTAREKLEAVEMEIDRLGFDPDHHAEAQDACSTAIEARDAARAEEVRAESALAAARQRLREADDRLREYDRRAAALRSLEADHRRHDAAADALNRFRAAAVSTIRPELETLTSGFVSLLTDGRHEAVEISESFDCTLYESGVRQEIVSGGTQDIAALAMRLAVSQMIAERAGHPLSLLVLDEPFGSLDDVRRGNVLTLIRRLSGVFAQVIIISHVEETRTSVDHVIAVEHDETQGRSTVQQWTLEAAAPRATAGAAA